MNDESNGMMLPGTFLPTADRFGLIEEIDRWMLKSAIGMLADAEAVDPESSLQVNLSSRSMVDPDLSGWIRRGLESRSVDPWRLILEVTETSVIHSMEDARRLAIGLSTLGCRFALDDFGAGFGAFNYLKHLPFEFLKIDGSFIRNLPGNRSDQHMVEAIINLSHQLGKLTIAECAENSETVDLLGSYDIDYIQGFQIGEPHPAGEIRPSSPDSTGRTE